MGKMKNAGRLFKKMNLKHAFEFHIAMFLVIVSILSVVTVVVADELGSAVAFYYVDDNDDLNEMNTDTDEDVRIAVDMLGNSFDNSSAKAIIFYSGNSYVALLILAYFVLGIILSARSFFKRRISVPLDKLVKASEKISESNLDFTVDYWRDDEMGMLCDSFEAMRAQLEENNKNLWNTITEQKNVQKAFSHDIRTPLTVTKGYVDLLYTYLPQNKISEEKLIETVGLIRNNLIRLENTVTVMSNVQKLNDMEVSVEKCSVEKLFKEINEDAKMICRGKEFIFNSETDSETAVTDPNIIHEIIMNVLSNAARFAKSKVTVSCRLKEETLRITVTDDGDGFSKEALRRGSELYFSESSQEEGHFGIGLNICSILSKKLGGDFSYFNSSEGAVVVAEFR